MCDFSETGNFSFNSGEELEQQRLELEIDSEPPESPTGVEIITDPEFWAENDRKIEERMKLRKERLRHFCENVYRNVSDDRKWDFFQNLWFLMLSFKESPIKETSRCTIGHIGLGIFTSEMDHIN